MEDISARLAPLPPRRALAEEEKPAVPCPLPKREMGGFWSPRSEKEVLVSVVSVAVVLGSALVAVMPRDVVDGEKRALLLMFRDFVRGATTTARWLVVCDRKASTGAIKARDAIANEEIFMVVYR